MKTLRVCDEDRRSCEKQLGRRFRCFNVLVDPDMEFSDYWFYDHDNDGSAVVGVMSDDDATLIKLSNPEVEMFYMPTLAYTYHAVINDWGDMFLARMHEYAEKNGYVEFKSRRYSLKMIEKELSNRDNETQQRREAYNGLEDKLENVSTKNLLKLYKKYRKTVALGYGHEHIMVAGVSISIEDVRTILHFREHITPK